MVGSVVLRRSSGLVVVVVALLAAVAPATHAGPWRRHTIDNSYLGADGARAEIGQFHVRPEFAVVWEQTGLTTLVSWPSPELAGCPWPYAIVGETPAAEDALAVDLDGDGDRDVVVCMEGTERRVSFFENKVDEFFEHVLPLHPFKWMIADAVDLDHDGRVDIVAGGRFVEQNQQGELVWIRPGPESAEIGSWTAQVISDVGWPMAILSLDLDGDGDDDLVVADRFGPSRGLRWLENPHPAVSDGPWTSRFVGMTSRRVKSAAACDLNEDGLVDFVATYEKVNNIPGGMMILLGGAGGWTEHPLALPAGIGEPKNVALADFDRNGLVDIALSCERAYDGLSGLCVFTQSAAGDWRPEDVAGPEGTKFDVLTAVDVDEDGDLDLITTEEGDNGAFEALGVVWYENPLIESPSPINSLVALEPRLCDEIPAPWLIELARRLVGSTESSATPPARR